MNLATDKIEAAHREAIELFDRFERRAHRARAMDICDLLERHAEMEDEILHPAMHRMDPQRAAASKAAHERLGELTEQVRSTSSRATLRELVGELRAAWRDHVRVEERDELPAMEEALGVAGMNALGFRIGDWHRSWERDVDEVDELLELTREELYDRAKEADIDGRSRMNKQDLAEALAP